jgi:DNA-binding transcriptional ArsR family regulator
MQTTSEDLPRRVADALGRGSRSDLTLRLADAFAAALDDEAAGVLLPSLRTLAGETGVHRNTVRAALELLADAGLVDRRPGGRYRTAAANAVSVVDPREPWPWIGAALGALLPRATPRLALDAVDADTSGLVLAAEIELDDVRARLPLAEVLGVGASVMVDVELGLADAPAGARVRVDASPAYVTAVGQVIARVRPDVQHVVSGPTDLVLVPVGATAPRGAAEVRRFRTEPGRTELRLIAARIAHHVPPPAAIASSTSSNGRAARQ